MTISAGMERIDPSASVPSGTSRVRWTGLYILAWTLVGVLAGSQTLLTYSAAGDGTPARLVYAVTLSYWLSWAVAGWIVLAAARRLPLTGGRRVPALLAHVALNAALPVGVLLLYRSARALLGHPPRATFRVDYVRTLNTSVIIYWGLVALVELVSRQRRLREKEQRAADLASRLKEAQLRELRAQIHPHFLFNTLNTIQAHIRDDPAGADDMITALADIMRSTLREDVPPEVSINSEVDFARRYLDLQKLRLGDRLHVRFELDPLAGEVRIPFLLLQPLVENAVEHGVEPRKEPGCVVVRTHMVDGGVLLEVEDDGVGPHTPRGKGGPGPLGLANVRARLRERYGESARLELHELGGGGTRAVVRIPFGTGDAGASRDGGRG